MQKMEQEKALAKMRDEVDRLRKQHQQEEYEYALVGDFGPLATR